MLIKLKNCGIITQISDTRESLLYLSVFSNITLSYEMVGQMVKSLKSLKGCVIMHIFLLYPNGKEKALTLSYDDVTDHNIKFIELLEKFNIKCTFNLNGSRLLSDNVDTKLYDNPLLEVSTHGFTHPIYTKMPTSAAMIEIIKDRQTLEEIFDRIIRGHAYPYGCNSEDIMEILKQAGIVYARTVQSHRSFKLPENWLRWGATCHHKDPELSNLTDKFLNDEVGNKDGFLFYLWGHAHEFPNDNNWNVIEEFFQRVANRDDIWYATNIEVYDYVTAYQNLVYSADAGMIYNPSATDVWVKIDGKAVQVPSGRTVVI